MAGKITNSLTGQVVKSWRNAAGSPLRKITRADTGQFISIQDDAGLGLVFTCVTGPCDVELTGIGNITVAKLECSYDGGATWTNFMVHGRPQIEVGQSLIVRASQTNTRFSLDSSHYYNFSIHNGTCTCKGDIMRLLDKDGAITTLDYDYEFYRLFYNCSGLITAPDITATTITKYGCAEMFGMCMDLEEAGKIEATTINNYGCSGMFTNCNSMVTPPPALYPTYLNAGAYNAMFQSCSSMQYSPHLYWETHSNSGIVGNNNMFYNCRNLKSIETEMRVFPSNSKWVTSVSSEGTFYCKSNLSKTFSDSAIPNGWTVVTH